MLGSEALVRWRQTDGKLIAPSFFIPLFEHNGFINKLDRYMFKKVCEQQKEWLEAGVDILPVSVNVSRTCLYDTHIVDEDGQIINEIGLPHEYIKLEITESAVFENAETIRVIINALRQYGFKILIDDFGTGYSSMLMLKNVYIDVLKLDKSFIDDIGDDRGEKIITNLRSEERRVGKEC